MLGQRLCTDPVLANFPLLLPNETLYSWCAEVASCCGGVPPHQLGKELFGWRSVALRHDLPGCLGHFSARVGFDPADGSSPMDHTLLGYYLTTLPVEEATLIVEQIKKSPAQHIKLSLGLPSSGMTTSHPLKVCPVCVTADERTLGRSYWHLDHQYPGVALCRQHGTTLLVYSGHRAPVTLSNWLRPEDALHAEWPESVPSGLPPETTATLYRLAELSAQLPTLGFGALSCGCVRAQYLSLLERMGQVTPSGSIRHRGTKALIERGLSTLRGLHIRGTSRQSIALIDLPLKLLVTPCRRHHPLAHCLLLTSLLPESEGAATFSQLLRMPADTTPSKIKKPKEPTARTQRILTDMVESQGNSISSAARALKVTTTTAIQWAKQLDIKFRARPKWLTQSIERKICSELISGKTIPNVCEASGASQTTVHRILSANPRVREVRRTKLLETDRARYRTEVVLAMQVRETLGGIRRECTSAYNWLYRHDRSWLQTTLRKQTH